MNQFVPKDPNYAERVRASFANQRVMATLGATLTAVAPGEVEISLPFREDLTQQHGFLHAGVVATIGDSACGYAAFSLMPADAGVLTIEYKINLLAPAHGEVFRAVGRVVRTGRTITVTQADVWSGETLVATLTATIMRRVPFRPFTIALVNGNKFEVDHADALIIREGVGVYIGPEGVPVIFDHEGVSQVIGDLMGRSAE